jgi:transcription antitermination factor NusG
MVAKMADVGEMAGAAVLDAGRWYILACAEGKERAREGQARSVQLDDEGDPVPAKPRPGAVERIEAEGGRAYVPMVRVWSRAGRGPAKDKRVAISVPALPGYVFVHEPGLALWDLMHRLEVFRSLGLRALVLNGRPITLTSLQMKVLRNWEARLFDETKPTPRSVLQLGNMVRIECGPMEGFEGEVTEIGPRSRNITIQIGARALRVPLDRVSSLPQYRSQDDSVEPGTPACRARDRHRPQVADRPQPPALPQWRSMGAKARSPETIT